MRKTVLVVILLLLSVSIVCAADHCVSPSGSGDDSGDDWNNTIDMSSNPAFTRGDTYYFADGAYSNWTLDDAVSGTDYIYIKKATESAHGTDTGWDSSYGDGQATITTTVSHIYLRSAYWDIDGVTGGGSSDPNSYGIKLVATGAHSGSTGRMINADTYDISNLVFQNIAVVGPGNTDPNCINGFKSSTDSADDLKIAYCYFSGCTVNVALYSPDNVTFENNYLYDNWSTGSCHGEQLTAQGSDDWIVRNNIFKDSDTGAIGIHGGGGPFVSDRWLVYNNIFDGGAVSMGVIGCADSSASYPDIMRDWEAYNNTVVGVTGTGNGAGIYGGYQSGSYTSITAYNNLFYDTSNPNNHSDNVDTVVHDYSGFFTCTGTMQAESNDVTENTDPFVDSAGGDYQLDTGVNAIDAGWDGSGTFTDDILGVTRPQGTDFDLGAYEYNSEAPESGPGKHSVSGITGWSGASIQ